MPPYFVVELEITNQAAMEPYRAAVGATITQYGGRFLTRGGATELIEGGPEPKRIVILEFTDTAAVKRWYNSPEYQKILRGGSTTRPAASSLAKAQASQSHQQRTRPPGGRRGAETAMPHGRPMLVVPGQGWLGP